MLGTYCWPFVKNRIKLISTPVTILFQREQTFAPDIKYFQRKKKAEIKWFGAARTQSVPGRPACPSAWPGLCGPILCEEIDEGLLKPRDIEHHKSQNFPQKFIYFPPVAILSSSRLSILLVASSAVAAAAAPVAAPAAVAGLNRPNSVIAGPAGGQ